MGAPWTGKKNMKPESYWRRLISNYNDLQPGERGHLLRTYGVSRSLLRVKAKELGIEIVKAGNLEECR